MVFYIRGFIDVGSKTAENWLSDFLREDLNFKGLVFNREGESLKDFAKLCPNCQKESVASTWIDSYCPECKKKLMEDS